MDLITLIVTIAFGIIATIIGIRQLKQVAESKTIENKNSTNTQPESVENKIVTFEKKDPYTYATNQALNIFLPDKSDDKLHVEEIKSPGLLYDLWKIDSAAYEHNSISFNLFLEWWKAKPTGLKALFYNSDVVGAVGIWPISKKWAEELKRGHGKESEMPLSALIKYKTKPTQFWYISGIVLTPDLRGTSAIKILLEGAIHSWITQEKHHFPLELLALAYSKEGEALLKRFGFFLQLKAGQTKDNMPLYRVSFVGDNELKGWLSKRNILS